MASQKELDYHQFDTLSTASTKLLLSGDFSADTQQRIQQELNAYCKLDPQTFAGIVYHADGSGPEKPYLRPEGADWTPEVQAIARIGFQYEYWSLLHQAAAAGKTEIALIKHSTILVLHPASSGRATVETNSYPKFLNTAAEEAGDLIPRFPKYVKLFNYGGDADFYNSDRNRIFPMDVRTGIGTKTDVTRETLGVAEEMVQNVWNSWDNISTEFGNSFHNAVLNTYVQFPYPIFELFNRALQGGEKFNNGASVAVLLMQNLNVANVDDVDTYYEMIKQSMGGPELNQKLLQATEAHARNLSILYETAKNNRADIYHY